MGITYVSKSRDDREVVIFFLRTLGKLDIIQSRILYLPLQSDRYGYEIKVEFYGK